MSPSWRCAKVRSWRYAAIQVREPDDGAWNLNFLSQTQKAVDLGLMPTHLKLALDRFNKFRNAFAHVFGHVLPADDVHALAHELEGYGVDFADAVGNSPAGLISIGAFALSGMKGTEGELLLPSLENEQGGGACRMDRKSGDSGVHALEATLAPVGIARMSSQRANAVHHGVQASQHRSHIIGHKIGDAGL